MEPANTIHTQAELFLGVLPHCRLMNMQLVRADKEGIQLLLPHSPRIIGHAEAGVVHGGALTCLMDTACGMSILCALPAFEVCPTLDLRIDYIRPARAGLDLYGEARCIRVTRQVLFVEGTAWQEDPDEPIARVVATFMRTGKGLAKEGRA